MKKEIIKDLQRVLEFFENTPEKNETGICKVLNDLEINIYDHFETLEFLSEKFYKLKNAYSYQCYIIKGKRKFVRVANHEGAYHFGSDKQRIGFLKKIIKELEK